MMNKSLATLNFGKPAAERDIDVGLADYFVESEAYQRVANRERPILLGNRGSGKSAIFKVLADRERRNGSVVLELRPEDYSYEMLSATLESENKGAWAKHGAFAAAWKYLLYVMIMKAVTESGAKLKTGEAAKIYEYLRDNHASSQDSPISFLISYVKRLEGIKIGNIEASLKSRELTKLYRLEELNDLLPALVKVCEKKKVLVFVDELDQGWDSSENAKAFVAGLFQACVSLNQLSPNLTVYVSLRRELYDTIPVLYEDAQKYRDMIETIDWEESSLLTLVAKRIRYSVPSLAAMDDSGVWNTVFAEVLQYRKTKSFNYMIDRTLYRPREIIQFCADAFGIAKGRHLSPVDYGAISDAEARYSEARTKDIAAEYRFQYPGLQSIFEVFRGHTYLLTREEIETKWLEIATGEAGVDSSASWVENQDHEFLTDVLYRVGFLRAYIVGGLKAKRRSGSSYVGPHQAPQLNLRSIGKFQVHPMFRAFLALKEPKSDAD